MKKTVTTRSQSRLCTSKDKCQQKKPYYITCGNIFRLVQHDLNSKTLICQQEGGLCKKYSPAHKEINQKFLLAPPKGYQWRHSHNKIHHKNPKALLHWNHRAYKKVRHCFKQNPIHKFTQFQDTHNHTINWLKELSNNKNRNYRQPKLNGKTIRYLR